MHTLVYQVTGTVVAAATLLLSFQGYLKITPFSNQCPTHCSKHSLFSITTCIPIAVMLLVCVLGACLLMYLSAIIQQMTHLDGYQLMINPEDLPDWLTSPHGDYEEGQREGQRSEGHDLI